MRRLGLVIPTAIRSGSQNHFTEYRKPLSSQSDLVASAARTLIRTSWSPGTGVGTSARCRTSGPP
jgi:hypothetical protein